MKKLKLLKKGLTLFLILFLCINNFAAIVSDNDGSAFITKAEFDSLKNDFQAQIDKYNTSIDMKIDGAIASYLAGIKMSRKTDVPVVVSNYNDILWKRKFDFFGGYVKYAGASPDYKPQDVWGEPEWKEFVTYRDKAMDGMFQFNRWQYGYIIGLRYITNFNTVRNVAAVNNDPYTYEVHQPTPIYLRCDYDSVDEIILGSKYHDEIIGAVWAYDTYHGANPMVGYSPEIWNGSGWTAASNNTRSLAPITEAGETTMGWKVLQPRTLGANDVIGFDLYCNRENSRSAWARIGGTWSIKEFNPAIPQCISLDAPDKKNRTINPTTIPEFAPDTFTLMGDGAIRNWYIEPGTGQPEKIKYTMFGVDENTTVNILRQSDVKVGRTPQMRTNLSNWFTVECTLSHITLASSARWSFDNGTERGSLDSKNIKFNLKYPYLERYPLKQITSGLFKNNGANIKMGEGLPISTYLNGKGTLTIQFDYTIGRTAQTVPSGEDKRIKIDVKKSDFLSGLNDYYSGTVDGSTSTVELKNVASGSSTSQKSKIVIENMKEGDEVWIRIAPYSTTAGLYAKMSNLTANVETED